MKKNVLLWGLCGGLVITLTMLYSVSLCYTRENFEGNMLLGYGSMLLAFSLIFLGVRNVRDRYQGGTITFGKAFRTGLYISLTASTLYVAAWLVDYYVFVPDFMDKYTAVIIKQMQDSGASALEVELKAKEMASYREMYNNPAGIILLTYAEVLPVGLVVSLFAALILKKKRRNGSEISG